MDAKSMLKAYETMPWLRSLTQKVSQDFSTLTWVVTKITGPDGRAAKDVNLQRSRNYAARSAMLHRYAKQGQLTTIPNHPILDMLTAGNEFFPGLVSMQLSQLYLDLIGEVAWVLERNRYGMPTGYIPIPPTWITRLPARTRDTADEGMYTVSGPGATYDVPASAMFFAYHPRPSNPFTRGTGLSQVLGDELETDEYAAKHTKDWFRNRAIPPVLISGLGVGIQELQRLEEKWLGKFMRVGAGWLPQFLGTKVDVHQLSQSFQQMELSGLRKNERDICRMVIGIPPEQIGDVSASNRSTIEASDYIYNSKVIVPRAEFFRAALQERIMPLYDERLLIDYISPVQEDREFMLKVRTAAPWAFDLDEWRGMGGCDALPAGRGKVHMMPFNLTPVRIGMGEKPAPPELPAPEPDEDAESEGDADETVDAIEPAKARKLLPAHKSAKESVAARVARIARAADVAVLTGRGHRVVTAVVEEFGQSTMVDLGVATTFDVTDPQVVTFLRRFGAERMAYVNATTQARIRATLTEGFENGESMRKLAKRVRDVFEDATVRRSMTIARTEVARASNFGAFEALRQADVEDKAWLATRDDHVRETHTGMDGQVQPLMEMFKSESGAEGMYPGDFGLPEEDINCRCGVVTTLAAKGPLRDAQWKTFDVARDPWIRMMRVEMSAAFSQQETAVIAALEKSKGSEESWTRTA
jgi:SPP1 gp7 family putative phage head morphogenesis protein